MVKLRNAKYCNLKLLLIFLVIYGHLIESQLHRSQILLVQYRAIYLFHMPMFCFLSGLFLNSCDSCKRQFQKCLSLYVLMQALAVCFGKGKVDPLTPYWHLWYILSCSAWSGLGWLWYRYFRGKGKGAILAISVILACLSGLLPGIGRALSLSRTVAFLPYFLLGLFLQPQFPWERLQKLSLVGLLIALALFAAWSDQIPTEFLYHASSYGQLGSGPALRLLCYAVGALICLFLLAFMPSRRFPFTKAGANTMPAYLLHAPFALLLRQQHLAWPLLLLICPGFLYASYKLLQWHGALYGIVPTERRVAVVWLSKDI